MATAGVATLKKSIWGGGISPFGVSWGKLYMWFFLLSDAFTFSSLIISYGVLRHRYTDIWPNCNDVFVHFPFIHGHIPLAYVGLMTFILIMSSVTMVLAVEAGQRRDNKGVILWLGLTIVGGFMFLGSQAWEWSHFIHGSETIAPHKGAYVLPDGRYARTMDYEEALILRDGTKLEGKEAEEWMAKGRLIQGANLKENEYGATPLFANFFFFITGFHGFHVFSGVVINIVIWINVIIGTYIRRGHYEQVEKAGLYWHFVDLVWVFVFTFFYLV
jgi:cytochrome c oxidase subunit 3